MIDAYCHFLFLMIAGHALADTALQPQRLSAQKAPPHRWIDRLQALTAHGLIHGGAVAVITGYWWLGAIETVAHVAIDAAKGSGRIRHLTDQTLHALCKVWWAAFVVLM